MTSANIKLGLTQTEHYTEVLNYSSSPEVEKLYQDDAVWIITSSFIIFTMHSGFGLLESGSVSAKDEVNIMVKNVVDVVFGGLSYWAVGYGLSYGDSEYLRNPIIGWGRFFYDPTMDDNHAQKEGWAYASFLFQLSLSTTASTIVSGAVAERAKLKSYILLGCFVILIQALPAHWIWDRNGFFFALGVVDFAGCSAVHMVGGVIGLIATIYLRPRRNRFNEDSIHQMSSPTNALLGTFMLWWGWFGINAGSVWGITSGRWRLGARASVATIMSSIGGGATAIVVSFSKTRKLQVNYLIDGLLSSIVSITAMCAVARPWQSLVIGSVSSAISISILPLLEKLKIDDPVGVVPIHLSSSIWGMIAVGIFAEDDHLLKPMYGQSGLIYSGSFRLLGIQLLCIVTILTYSGIFGLVVLVGLDKSPLGLRVTDYEEQIGADVIEHGLAGTNVARYHVEKPLSSKTFATVTKAITKWKLQTKARRREQRQQMFQQRMEERKQNELRVAEFRRKQLATTKSNGNLLNGVVLGNGFAPKPGGRARMSVPNELTDGTGVSALGLRGVGRLTPLSRATQRLTQFSSVDETAIGSGPSTEADSSRSLRESFAADSAASVVSNPDDVATQGPSNSRTDVISSAEGEESPGTSATKQSYVQGRIAKALARIAAEEGQENDVEMQAVAGAGTDAQGSETGGSNTSFSRVSKNKIAPL